MNYTKPKLKQGQAFCEGCGGVFIDFAVKPIMFDGRFFNACKSCQSLHSRGEFHPICYPTQNEVNKQ